MHRVDKRLSIVPTEVTDNIDLGLTCKDYLDQRDGFVRGEGMANQASTG